MGAYAIVFVYAKDSEIKVLDAIQASESHQSLTSSGWKHTKTIDVRVWMEYLHNICMEKDIAGEIKSLKDV